MEKYSMANTKGKIQVITKKIHILSMYIHSYVYTQIIYMTDIQKVASCNYIWYFWKLLLILPMALYLNLLLFLHGVGVRGKAKNDWQSKKTKSIYIQKGVKLRNHARAL